MRALAPAEHPVDIRVSGAKRRRIASTARWTTRNRTGWGGVVPLTSRVWRLKCRRAPRSAAGIVAWRTAPGAVPGSRPSSVSSLTSKTVTCPTRTTPPPDVRNALFALRVTATRWSRKYFASFAGRCARHNARARDRAAGERLPFDAFANRSRRVAGPVVRPNAGGGRRRGGRRPGVAMPRERRWSDVVSMIRDHDFARPSDRVAALLAAGVPGRAIPPLDVADFVDALWVATASGPSPVWDPGDVTGGPATPSLTLVGPRVGKCPAASECPEHRPPTRSGLHRTASCRRSGRWRERPCGSPSHCLAAVAR